MGGLPGYLEKLRSGIGASKQCANSILNNSDLFLSTSY